MAPLTEHQVSNLAAWHCTSCGGRWDTAQAAQAAIMGLRFCSGCKANRALEQECAHLRTQLAAQQAGQAASVQLIAEQCYRHVTERDAAVERARANDFDRSNARDLARRFLLWWEGKTCTMMVEDEAHYLGGLVALAKALS